LKEIDKKARKILTIYTFHKRSDIDRKDLKVVEVWSASKIVSKLRKAIFTNMCHRARRLCLSL